MKLLRFLTSSIPERIAYAHCDIPCGIYDPTPLQIAAHTVIRMTQLLDDLDKIDGTNVVHDVSRLTRVKEEHGKRVEDELGTLENDYFKDEHFTSYPELKGLIEESVKLSAKVRQTIDIETADKLLEKILLISEIFYKTKNVIPVRVKSLYPTERQMVTYKE